MPKVKYSNCYVNSYNRRKSVKQRMKRLGLIKRNASNRTVEYHSEQNHSANNLYQESENINDDIIVEAADNDCNSSDLSLTQSEIVNAEIIVGASINNECNLSNASVTQRTRSISPSSIQNENFENSDHWEMNINDEETVTDISGRRIVNFKYLFEQFKDVSKHGPLDCGLNYIEIINERRKGLISTFTVKCTMCNFQTKLKSDIENPLNANECAVLGTISTGNGYSQMSEMHASLDIPPMTNYTYTKCHENIRPILHETLWESIEAAANEEAQLAKDLGDVNEDGIPLITVIVDGAWCRRSYKNNYAANSGVGCIIGQRTGKLLFLGIRNKYCTVCSRAKSKNVEVPSHMCFKNWNGTSTAMEADIIVEGFVKSIALHGIIYNKIVGDGDSSVTRKLMEARPYHTYDIVVQKVECRNHLLRNYCSKLSELSKKRLSSQQKVVPLILRNEVKSNIIRLRMAVTKAVEYRKNQNIPHEEKIKLLKKDLLNGPSHIFGEHQHCKELGYFCNENYCTSSIVEEMKKTGLYADIVYNINRLVHNASSLILDMDNNAAESYNSVLCKFVGGKRVNFALKGSYQMRAEAAGIAYNHNMSYYNQVFNRCHVDIGVHTQNFISKKIKARDYTKQRRLLVPKQRRKKIEQADFDYGAVEAEPELSVEEFEERKKQILRNLDEDRILIEKRTRGQSNNPNWILERKRRLTASCFGKVCRLRQSTCRETVVGNILYSKFTGNKATEYGILHERSALDAFIQKLNLHEDDVDRNCGLYVHNNYSFLGASPDAIIKTQDAIIEVKCPYSAAKWSIEEAISEKLIKFATFEENQLKLKKTHQYMYQVQGQLEISGRSKCYFVVWTPQQLLYQIIYRDHQFWNTKMKPHLIEFYENHLLPEIVTEKIYKKLMQKNKKYTNL